MDFENLFSKPPNPALGKKPAADPEERIDEIDGTEVEETQTEKVKWKVKRDREQIPKKFKHLGNAATSPKSLPRKKSRSKDYDPYSDGETCSQGSEDNFDKELQQYIQAKEMVNAAQPSLLPEESVKKAGAEGTQQTAKQKNKKSKAGHKKVKQKKMKRKWPGTGDKGSRALLKNSGSREQTDEAEEKQPRVRMSQGFINQHTVERKGKQVCKYFLERKCIKGDQCKFDHDAEIEKKKEMCKYYVQGYCTKGENCLYLHNILYHKIPCTLPRTGQIQTLMNYDCCCNTGVLFTPNSYQSGYIQSDYIPYAFEWTFPKNLLTYRSVLLLMGGGRFKRPSQTQENNVISAVIVSN